MTAKEAEKMKAEAKKLTLGKWYVGFLNGKTEEVMLMADVMKIIDKYTENMEYSILDREMGGNIRYTDSTDWKG